MPRPDALVIGAGIIGASIAWRLAQRGLRITIVDAGRFGGEASWAGAGMLAPGGEVEGESLWGRRSVESLGMYRDFVRELEAESGRSIDYRVCGALELAFTAEEAARNEARAAGQERLGIPSRGIEAKEILEIAPALRIDALRQARYYPDDAIVDPRDVTAALRAARAVEIRENFRVVGIEASAGAVVFANGDRLEAGAVVLAAGAWSSGVAPGLCESFPVKGHLVGYDLRPGSLGPTIRHGHTYILQRNSGFTVAGSTTERAGFDRNVDPAIVSRLHRRARRYLPGLLRASPDASWVGFRPGVTGDEPQVGRYGDTRLWLAYGHYRNGILLAPVTAQLIADEVTSN